MFRVGLSAKRWPALPDQKEFDGLELICSVRPSPLCLQAIVAGGRASLTLSRSVLQSILDGE